MTPSAQVAIAGAALTATGAAIGSGALAADALPLVRGIYVLSGSRCKGAPNVATLSYWGEMNGINSQALSCTIKALEKRGATYVLRRTCRDIRYDGAFEDRIQIDVLSPSSFRLGSDTYRRCGSRVE